MPDRESDKFFLLYNSICVDNLVLINAQTQIFLRIIHGYSMHKGRCRDIIPMP
jgi:hypothetical protein